MKLFVGGGEAVGFGSVLKLVVGAEGACTEAAVDTFRAIVG